MYQAADQLRFEPPIMTFPVAFPPYAPSPASAALIRDHFKNGKLIRHRVGIVLDFLCGRSEESGDFHSVTKIACRKILEA